MSYVGLGLVEVNPLDSQSLPPGWKVVTGPQWTGPRQTVVEVANPSQWRPWITQGPSGPVDEGQVAGGTWEGQRLPDLVATAVPGWVWLVALAVAYYLVFGKRGSRGDW